MWVSRALLHMSNRQTAEVPVQHGRSSASLDVDRDFQDCSLSVSIYSWLVDIQGSSADVYTKRQPKTIGGAQALLGISTFLLMISRALPGADIYTHKQTLL